jgi:hypothetical protein
MFKRSAGHLGVTLKGNNEMNSIRKDVPTTQQDLQQFASEFWEQCGFTTKVDCEIVTAEGTMTISVCAYEGTDRVEPVSLCECRHGSDPVPDDIIQDFGTIVRASNAKTGFILSGTARADDPSGIDETVDIRLLTWPEFQDHFSKQWVRYQTEKVQQDAEDLRNYCDPLEKYVSERLRKETDAFRKQYRVLSEKHMPMGMLSHKWNLPSTLLQGEELFEAFECRDAWNFMIKLGEMLKEGLKEFDDLFVEKWRG